MTKLEFPAAVGKWQPKKWPLSCEAAKRENNNKTLAPTQTQNSGYQQLVQHPLCFML